jgi:DHA1 family bicyclomycin/chloramphenicol resistance-like MFS transporter
MKPLQCCFLFLACLGISNPNTADLPFHFQEMPVVSALMGAIQWGLGALASFAVVFCKKFYVANGLDYDITIWQLDYFNFGKRNIKKNYYNFR